MIRLASVGGNALYKEEALWVLRLTITRMIFSASGNISSDKYLISVLNTLLFENNVYIIKMIIYKTINGLFAFRVGIDFP